MKTGAIAAYILAVLTAIVATFNVFYGGPNRPDKPEDLAGYAVGSYLWPVGLLILGSWLWNRKSSGPPPPPIRSRSEAPERPAGDGGD